MIMGIVVSIVYFSIQLFLSLGSVCLNSLVVIGLVKDTSLHTPSNAVLGLLGCCDLLIGVLSLSVWSLNVLLTFGNSNTSNFEAFYAIAEVYFAFSGLSSLFIMFLSLDRLTAICYPFKYLQRATLNLYIAISMPISVIYMMMMGTPISVDLRYHSIIASSIFITIVSTAMIILIYCNWRILKVILRQRREIASTECNIERQHTRLQRESNRYRIIVILVILYIFCQAPQLIGLLIVLTDMFQYSTSLHIFFLVSDILLMLNSFFNPLVYCFRIPSFRRAVKDILSFRRQSVNWVLS